MRNVNGDPSSRRKMILDRNLDLQRKEISVEMINCQQVVIGFPL